MTDLELILLALRSQETKLRRKADKAFRDGRPTSHVRALYDNAEEVRNVRQRIKVGKVVISDATGIEREGVEETAEVAGTS